MEITINDIVIFELDFTNKLDPGTPVPESRPTMFADEVIEKIKRKQKSALPHWVFNTLEDWVAKFTEIQANRISMEKNNDRSIDKLRNRRAMSKFANLCGPLKKINFGKHPLQKIIAEELDTKVQNMFEQFKLAAHNALIDGREKLKNEISHMRCNEEAKQYAVDSWVKLCGGSGKPNQFDVMYDISHRDDHVTLSSILFSWAHHIALHQAIRNVADSEAKKSSQAAERERKQRERTAAAAAQAAAAQPNSPDFMKHVQDTILVVVEKAVKKHLKILNRKNGNGSGGTIHPPHPRNGNHNQNRNSRDGQRDRQSQSRSRSRSRSNSRDDQAARQRRARSPHPRAMANGTSSSNRVGGRRGRRSDSAGSSGSRRSRSGSRGRHNRPAQSSSRHQSRGMPHQSSRPQPSPSPSRRNKRSSHSEENDDYQGGSGGRSNSKRRNQAGSGPQGQIQNRQGGGGGGRHGAPRLTY
jgi:hypothetical protein